LRPRTASGRRAAFRRNRQNNGDAIWYLCPVDGRQFLNRTALYAHMSTHHRRHRSPSPEAAGARGPSSFRACCSCSSRRIPPAGAISMGCSGPSFEDPWSWDQACCLACTWPLVGVAGQENGPGGPVGQNPNDFPRNWLALGINGGEVDDDGISLEEADDSSESTTRGFRAEETK
ncbi:hypothetical protein Ancab_013726, partial [Ancistrocladus abbreviatus]